MVGAAASADVDGARGSSSGRSDLYLCRVSCVKLTRATLAVLDAFVVAGPDGRLYGRQIMEGCALKSGSLYPILDRLEAAGWIAGSWEELAEDVGRPRRRYYSLTPAGAVQATQALARAAGRINHAPTLRPVTS
jgi:PadR family transcriptional regulator, regulatory protein PadR